MAKKRRVRSTSSAPARTVPAPAREVPVSASPAPARRPTSALANYDYSYVRRDLRRIGVLAAILFGGQIVLAFLLPHLLR
ncbi:hypothetical protein HRbin22_01520 [Candidatus Thermoflexus japonica]|uniref:Uncharacterized protein n=1 Tax=Candidatus Thermoflexus japonica TaxID=2035417 RepID=A0A2H5Y757_9CHLR|nr:hypothetical protein HRbin22_01520 [Candidatus Thermoflexus japonica]